MASKCCKCDVDLSQTAEVLKCCDCSATFHTSCVSSRSATRAKTRQPWKCDACVIETSSTGSRGADRDTSVLEAIASFRKEFQTRSDAADVKLNSMQVKINEVATDVTLLKKQNEELQLKHTKLNQDVSALQAENRRLSDEVTALRSEVCELQQHTRKNNVIVSGVPVTPRENIYGLLECIARVMDVPYNYEISAAHRLPSRQGDSRPPSIVVCFISRRTKEIWINERRHKKSLSAKELNNIFPDQQVYINEHLTPPTRELFNAARSLMKSNQLSSVWTRDCRVMVKRSPTDRPVRIVQMQQLEERRRPEAAESSVPPSANTAVAPPPPTTAAASPPITTAASR